MTNNYFSSDGRLFYFWKGRVALYAILKALGVGPGDEIILPAFTCVVVPNAILYLGARPIYADIEPDSYNLSARTVEPLITARTRVILGQNTFGLSADLDPLMALARDYRLTMVEDCAHGLGGSYKGRPNGTVADAAFFSSQWSKPFSTGLGGVAYTANPALAQAIAPIAAAMSRPGLGQQAMLQGQLWLRPLANQPRLYYGLVGVYRYLTQTMGLSVGSSSQSELVSITQPAGYAQQMSHFQRQGWARGLAGLAANIQRRQQVAAGYDAFFKARGLDIPYRPGYAGHAMLRYTLRVANRDGLLEQARRCHIPIGDWFSSPLYPIKTHLERWGYRAGQCPVAEQACREVFNLLTERPLTERQLTILAERGEWQRMENRECRIRT